MMALLIIVKKLLKKLHKMIHVFAFSMLKWGIGKAFNLGVSEAKGEYIAEFESDDYVALHAYERLYNTAKSHHADVVRCNWVEFSSEEEVERDILWQYPDKYNQLIDLKRRI